MNKNRRTTQINRITNIVALTAMCFPGFVLAQPVVNDTVNASPQRLSITGPNLQDNANKIDVEGPTMPELTFEVNIPEELQATLQDAQYHWQFMVEYIVPLTGDGADKSRLGIAGTVNNERDGFLISSAALPANLERTGSTTPYTDYREWFATNSNYTATGSLLQTNNPVFILADDCGTRTNCREWGDNFGGGFIYVAVKVFKAAVPPDQPEFKRWLTWGVGRCTQTSCVANDYAQRNRQLLAREPGVNGNSTDLAAKGNTEMWRYITTRFTNQGYNETTYRLTQAEAEEVMRGITERETNVKQFNSGRLGGIVTWMQVGMPTVAADGGFGATQLTSFNPGTGSRRPSYSELWNWRTHIDISIATYLSLLTNSVADLTENSHAPSLDEIQQDSLAKWNGGIGSNYYTWVERNIDADSMPRTIPLTGTDFPVDETTGNASTGAQFNFSLGTAPNEGNFYRDLVFCIHASTYQEGPKPYLAEQNIIQIVDQSVVTGNDCPLPTGANQHGRTAGYWQEYGFTSDNLSFSNNARCLGGSSNCYVDQTRNDTIHLPEIDDNVIVRPHIQQLPTQ